MKRRARKLAELAVSANAVGNARSPKRESSDELVWHYTGFAGLEGILNGSIWASSAAYLNDTQEFRYAIDIAVRVLGEDIKLSEGGEVRFRKAVLDQALEIVNKVSSRIDGSNVFVTSFSTRGDDLSQWRAYGGKGPAFAIGFRPEALKAKAAAVSFDLVKVWYDESFIEQEIKALLREHYDFPHPDAAVRASPSRREERVSLGVIGDLIRVAARCKDKSFEAEGEWRLVRHVDQPSTHASLPWKFRQSGSLIVPYVEIPLHHVPHIAGTSPVAEIIVGPSPHPRELTYAVERMATGKGMLVPVSRSSVPFRNW